MKDDQVLKELKKKYKVVNKSDAGHYYISSVLIDYRQVVYDGRNLREGCWGLADSEGNVLIEPQYLHYWDVHNGYTIFAQGKWGIGILDTHPDNYYYEEGKWEIVDQKGNIIVPFEFDEIYMFDDYKTEETYSHIFQAKIGKYPNRKWGVIDDRGNWVVEPIFEEFYYRFYRDGEVIYYGEDEECLLGVYDIINKQVVLEPIYDCLDFFGKNLYLISVWEDGIEFEKIIDRTGREVFDSRYNGISEIEGYDYYEVLTYDEHGNHRKKGIIDLEGNVIVEPSEELFEKYAAFKSDIRELVEEIEERNI